MSFNADFVLFSGRSKSALLFYRRSTVKSIKQHMLVDGEVRKIQPLYYNISNKDSKEKIAYKKQCRRQWMRNYKQINKQKLSLKRKQKLQSLTSQQRKEKIEYHKNYYSKNIQKQKQKHNNWRQQNKQFKVKIDKQYRQSNMQKIKQKKKQYYQKNKEQILVKCKDYRDDHRQETNKRAAKKKQIDPVHAFKCAIRSNISNAFKRCYKNKNSSTTQLLGMQIVEFRDYIQRLFIDGMTWQNYGKKWTLDHIVPLAVSHTLPTDAQQFQCVEKLNHYSNFQPMFKSENIVKYDSLEYTSYFKDKHFDSFYSR